MTSSWSAYGFRYKPAIRTHVMDQITLRAVKCKFPEAKPDEP